MNTETLKVQLIPMVFVWVCGFCGWIHRELNGEVGEVECCNCGVKHTVTNSFAPTDLRPLLAIRKPSVTAVME